MENPKLPTGLSPALTLVKFVFDHAMEASHLTGKYWFRMAVRDAIYLAARSLRFEPDDFQSDYLSNWVGGDGRTYGEGFYEVACKWQNLSACHAFERWKGRKPFIFEGQRMFVGRYFRWQVDNEIRDCMCTSFSEDGSRFIAIFRDEDKHQRILRITRKKLQEAGRARKKSAH